MVNIRFGLKVFKIQSDYPAGGVTTIWAKNEAQAWAKFCEQFGRFKPDPTDYVITKSTLDGE